ncbi:helix-turn-helix domain-containing protein [Psychrobacillus sp. NPDC096426]|uniref:helix-turn-helix domain-containing protein n=1 Tax=Psychrobacillus sp. NPDC096426 TaxID=3364491 RepID=UPI00382664E0
MGVGLKIKYFRTKSKLTQKELALGVCSVSHLSKIEHDIVEPSEDMFDIFCTKLGINKTDIYKEEELLHYLQLNALNIHKLIRSGDKEKAILLYEEITVKTSLNDWPIIRIFYVLFGLRIALMKKEREVSFELYEEIVGIMEYAPEWMKPYYNRYCGLYHYMYGSLSQSLKLYKEAEKLTPESEIEDIYYQLALVHHMLGEYPMSTYYEEKALELFARRMDYEQCVNCQLLLGINYRKMGNLEQAKETYLSILKKVEPLHNREIIAKVYHNLGMIYSDEGKLSETVTAFEISMDYRDNDHARVKTCYAILKEFLHDADETNSKKWLNIGERISTDLKDKEYLIKFQVLKYKLEKLENDPIFEHYMLTVALPYFEERSDQQMIKEYIKELVRYYEECRQYKSALMYLKKLL